MPSASSFLGLAVARRLVLAALLIAALLLLVIGVAAAVVPHVERVEQIVDRIGKPALVLTTFSSRSRLRPARSSIHGATIDQLAGGGRRRLPVRRSRTIRASASSIGASARSVISSNLPRWKRSSSIAERFCATLHAPRADRLDPRLLDRLEHGARLLPPGCRRRWIAGSWQASRSAIESAWPRTIAASAN